MGNYTKLSKAFKNVGAKFDSATKQAGEKLESAAETALVDAANPDAKRERAQKAFDEREKIGSPSIDKTKKSMVAFADNFITNSAYTIEDPAFDCVMWQIDWDDKSGLFADEYYINSALAFLKRNGEESRYNALKRVISQLKNMFDVKTSGTRNYFLKSIDGLNTLNENRRKLGVDSILSISCYENVKWEMREISQMLDYIYYDSVRQLHVLPKNLRRFSCYMFVTDARDLSDYAEHIEEVNESRAGMKRNGGKTKSTIEEPIFSTKEGSNYAEFLQTPDGRNLQSMVITIPVAYLETNPYPDTISNIEPTELTATLSLNARVYHVDSLFAASRYYISQLETAVAARDKAAMDKNIQDSKSSGGIMSVERDHMTGKRRFGKILGQVGKSFAKKAAAIAIAKGKQFATTYAMNAANKFLADTGALDAINKALSFTKPDLLLAKYGDKIAKKLDHIIGLNTRGASDIVRDMYFTDQRHLDDYIENADVQYKSDLGSLHSESKEDPQYKPDLGTARDEE